MKHIIVHEIRILFLLFLLEFTNSAFIPPILSNFINISEYGFTTATLIQGSISSEKSNLSSAYTAGQISDRKELSSKPCSL